MYVLHDALGLPEEKMIVPMDEKARKTVASRDTEWWQLRKALHQVWAFHTTRHGKEILLEDMEKYALREILSCRGVE